MDRYEAVLREVLEIPPLDEECAGASRVMRWVFKPAFKPECALAIIERDGVAEMSVCVPARSVWSMMEARHGGRDVEPVAGWVKPALSVERIVMDDALEGWDAEAVESAPVSGIDGMSVDVLLWRPGREQRFSVWFGAYDDRDSRHRWLRAVVDAGLQRSTWETSLTALSRARAHLR